MTGDRSEQSVAVRAWTTTPTDKTKKGGGRTWHDPGPSDWSLTFDTETTLDPGQGLRAGAYQLRRRSRLREEGLFYELTALTAEEIATLKAFADIEGLVVRTRDEFVEDVFLPTAWDRRGLIIGHNLPFDLSRISIANAPAQSQYKSMRGGFSLRLSRDPTHSHIQVKRINAGSAFIRLTIPSGVSPEKRNQTHGGRTANHHGYFLDTATIGGALLGGRPSLRRLAEMLKTATQKGDEDHGEQLSAAYLTYLRTDVQVTSECSIALRERYDAYGLPKRAWQIHSEAGIGKAHLEKIGLTPFRQLNDWPDQVLAKVMETYYGGRTESMIRRTPVPGVYVDFKSQYPTSYILQDLHRYLIADEVTWKHEDPAITQQLLNDITVADVLNKTTWSRLDVLVLIAPDGDRLPTRTRYARRVAKRRGKPLYGSMNVGLAYRTGGPAQWYTLADAVASKLMTGKAPHVLRTLRFQAGTRQDDLCAIDIAGKPSYRVDPAREDLIRRLVELRADVKNDKKRAHNAGDEAETALLDGAQQGMKATANSTAFGSPIEINPIEHRKPEWVTVHLPDATSYRVPVNRTEQPGKWFHPLIATLVAAGGRLLLAAAMRLVADDGGHYAFCDTDSLFIVAAEEARAIACAGGHERDEHDQPAILALSWKQVQLIVDRFEALNPYNTIHGSILEIEDENYDPDTGRQREIECFTIASKRYALFIREPDARPRLIASGNKLKRSEHGLGHLLSPYLPTPGEDPRRWMDEWWQHILCRELGFEDPEPPWFDDPAIGRLTVTSPRDLKIFKTYNADRVYADQVKPWGFLSIAQPTSHERGRRDGPNCLIGPFERDPERRGAMTWIERDHPERTPKHIRTAQLAIRDDSVVVLSYRDYYDKYIQHPEAKALDPRDRQPCHTWTRGLLAPRAIVATALRRVGKESNRLADNSEFPIEDESDCLIEYPPATRECRGCAERVSGRRRWCSDGLSKTLCQGT